VFAWKEEAPTFARAPRASRHDALPEVVIAAGPQYGGKKRKTVEKEGVADDVFSAIVLPSNLPPATSSSRASGSETAAPKSKVMKSNAISSASSLGMPASAAVGFHPR
jgi:hypothetical protein